MNSIGPKIERCHFEIMEIVEILRSIEISTGSDQCGSLPQKFDFAIQRMEGLAEFVDFISKNCGEDKNSQTEEQIALPLEISRKNLLLIEMDDASKNDIEIF